MPNLLHRLALGLVLVTAVVCSFQAWSRLEGYLLHSEVEKMKTKWRAGDSVPHDRELLEAFKVGYEALEHEIDNPDYRFSVAGLHAWRERTLRLWPDRAKAENQKIEENLKAALVLRPSWFEAWILLALVKYQSNELDNEFVVAVEKSLETGRYETAVHHGLAIIGPRTWDRFDSLTRDAIIETLHIALDNPYVYDFVVEQIVMAGKVDLFRGKLESDRSLKGKMNKYLKKRKEAL